VDNAAYVAIGYGLTALGLAAYVAGLFSRARRARLRAAALSSKQARP
jgi:hypothetical protein